MTELDVAIREYVRLLIDLANATNRPDFVVTADVLRQELRAIRIVNVDPEFEENEMQDSDATINSESDESDESESIITEYDSDFDADEFEDEGIYSN